METHINTDKIDYIKFTPMGDKHTWYPEYPCVYTFFGLIETRKKLEAGWSNDDYRHRYSVSTLKSYKYIFINPDIPENDIDYPRNGYWLKKANVYVRTKVTGHTTYFDSDEEAKAWIELITSMSNAEFAVTTVL